MEFEQYCSTALENMVSQQCLTNRITHPGLIDALRQTPRHLFVPQSRRNIAYIDDVVPLDIATNGVERFMLPALTIAQMLQLVEPDEEHNLLYIGAGCGYGVALAAQLYKWVVGVELDEILAARANNHMRECNIKNASIAIGEYLSGHEPQSPYNAMIIAGTCYDIPEALLHQLRHGARVVTILPDEGPSRTAGLVGRVSMGVYQGGSIAFHPFHDAPLFTLPGLKADEGFVF